MFPKRLQTRAHTHTHSHSLEPETTGERDGGGEERKVERDLMQSLGLLPDPVYLPKTITS